MEAEQHTTKQAIHRWGSERGNKKISADKWKHNIPKSLGCSKSSSKGEVYNDTSLSQETRKISNILTLHLKQQGK